MTPPSATDLKVRPSRGTGGFGSDFKDEDPPSERGGGGSGWVALLRAPNDIDAHLLTGRLAESGIETTCLKDRSAPGAWLHGGSDPWAPVTILVRKIQLQDARLVLAELAYERPAVDPAVETGNRSRWRGPLVWWAAAVGLGLLFTALGLVQAANDMDQCSKPAACSVAKP